MKKRVWHVDFVGGLIIAGLVALAYYFDGPTAPDNAIKPITTKTPDIEHQIRCLDGMPPVNWRCPDGDRL